jgi:GNAT superfamily N-acetyltransferase
MTVTFEWRGACTTAEVNRLHADAFETRVLDDSERDWPQLLDRHSLGWVVARDGERLVGFVNVIWDGRAHAWLQDTMVEREAQGTGIGAHLVSTARDQALAAGCQWLHVDYDDALSHFYEVVCGFAPTRAGLIALT